MIRSTDTGKWIDTAGAKLGPPLQAPLTRKGSLPILYASTRSVRSEEDMRRRRRRREVWHWVLHMRREESKAQVGPLYVHHLRNCVRPITNLRWIRRVLGGHDTIKYAKVITVAVTPYFYALYMLLYIPLCPTDPVRLSRLSRRVRRYRSRVLYAPRRRDSPAGSEGDMIVVEYLMWLLPPL